MKPFLDCKEISESLDCSRAMAYKILGNTMTEIKDDIENAKDELRAMEE